MAAEDIMAQRILMNLTLLKNNLTQVKWTCVLLVGIAAVVWSPLPNQTQLERVLNEGSLGVAARSGPLTYYERDGIPNGLD